MKTQANEQRKGWFKNKRNIFTRAFRWFSGLLMPFLFFWCLCVLMSLMFCGGVSVSWSLQPFSVSFLFNKVSLFVLSALGSYFSLNMMSTIFTPCYYGPHSKSCHKLPQMSSAAGRDFDLTVSVVCVCFSCDWIAYIHPGCWHSRMWAVLLGRFGFSIWPAAALGSLFSLLWAGSVSQGSGKWTG